MTTQNESPTADREIVATRIFDAPRELVWTAWTRPEHVGHWWGPHGFTLTTHEIDVRPGGIWRFVMHGPDGTDFKNKIVFIEVLPPERLIYSHSGEDETAHLHFTATVTFTDLGGKTELSLRSVFETPEERDHVVAEFGAVEGAKQTLERLSEYIATLEAA